MKAVQINKYGGVEVIAINNNALKSTPSKGQILVEVHAVSINPFDSAVRAGYMDKMKPLEFPATVGGDFAGVITQVGETVSDFKVGDEVYGSANLFNGGSGSFAEFAVSNTSNSAFKPKSINFLEAASLPLVGSSAVQALEEHIKLQSGQKILIHGGVGGIGSIAIQLAKIRGAYVATTVSGDDKEFVKNLGADEVVDYKTEKFEEKLREYDAVFDPVGGEITNKSFLVLKKEGVLVSMLGQPDSEIAKKYEVTAIGQGTKVNTAHLNRLTELVDSGKIKPQIAKIFTLEKAKEAFSYAEEGHPRGKVVLKIKD